MQMVHTFPIMGILPGQILFFEWDTLWRMAIMVGVCALGTWIIIRFKRWRLEISEQSATAPEEQLDHYQQMVEDGLLDPDEFARIKDHMKKQASEGPAQPQDPPPANESAESSP